ncbi:unnamed protein product [Ophioblennius macclurei]
MPAGESEERGKTRERFNEVFKKYREKKKSPEGAETIVLQSLQKNLNLVKSSKDDETVIQNTYDPERASPRFTKNRRRQEEVAQKVNNNSRNQKEVRRSKSKSQSQRELISTPGPGLGSGPEFSQAFRSAPDPDGGKEPKQRSKKGRSGAKEQVEDPEDRLLHEYQQRIEAQEDRTSTRTRDQDASPNVRLNNDVGKKKKKKLRSVVSQIDVEDQDGGQRSPPGDKDGGQRSPPADQEGGQRSPPGDQDGSGDVVEKKKKTKKKQKHVPEEVEDAAAAEEEPAFDDSLVLGVLVHQTDGLQTDLLVSHPMVKVHVVDELTGQYVKKEDSRRPVSSYYEQENVDHILPIMTQPFDFREKKSSVPEWQEQIVFNERFGYFLQRNQHSPRVILFFEILDLVTMEEARANVDVEKHERGFRKVAWAFLKIVGANGVLNIDRKLRLQLFCRPPRAKRQPKTIEVVEWWKTYPKTKYSSTLYVTVKGLKLPEHVDPGVRSMMALQEERGSTSFSELQQEVAQRNPTLPPENKEPHCRWSRLPGQICRIPNRPMMSFRGGHMGCFTLVFSHAGTLLAAACADRDAFPVVVYEIPSGKVLAAFSGHFRIVYELCWSKDDRRLLSASSDGTVREWDVEKLQAAAQKVLPHPSFVYCSRYHPVAQNLVLTGGYDGLIRVWRLDVDHVNGRLLQEFEGHQSFVNTLCFDAEGNRTFSADGSGVILVWRTGETDSRTRPCQLWGVEKRIVEAELRGVAISALQLHPNGRCLLVHARDSVLRMLDLRILVVKKFSGATNQRERICSCLTPCGSFLFSGSEDGMAYVWNADTGEQVAMYSELGYPSPLHAVAYHPHENMVAFCALAQSQPIHLYLYDRTVSQLEIHSLKTWSRPMSVNSPDSAVLQDSLNQCSHATRLALKMQCVKEQLDSVLEPRGTSSAGGDADKLSVTRGGRSLPSEAGTGHNVALPALRSPHTRLPLLPAGFSSLSRQLPAEASCRMHQSSFDLQPSDSAPPQQVVFSLQDYAASRSDELSVRRGDAIQVLYKDNDSWWFGRLLDGQQGYFLASCVVDQGNFNKTAETQTPLSEATDERSTPTRVSAAISSSGELRFLSEPTLSDTEPEPELSSTRSRRKKKVKKPPGGPSQVSGSGAEVVGSSRSSVRVRRSARSADRPLPARPTEGRSNGAE